MPAKKPAASRAATKTPKATMKSNAKTKRGTTSRGKAVATKKTRGRGVATSNRRLVGVLLASVGVLLAFALFSSGNSGSVKPSPGAKPLLENGGLWQSAVQVSWATRDSDESLSHCWGGSGGLVGALDQVLTNEHVVDDSKIENDCAEAKLFVGYPVEPTGVYFVWWPGEVRGVNEFTDLALVDVDLTATAIVDSSDYPALTVLNHTWPVFTVAPKDPVIGAPISIYSYPGIGGYSMTFTAGYVAGWTWDTWSKEDAAEMGAKWNEGYKADPDGYLDFMKLDVTVSGGSSGSSVLNAAGEIVGVTVIVGANRLGETTDCRSLADTNGDGEIDDTDSCVPVGGFINGAVTLTDVRAFLARQGVDLNP